MPKVQEKVPEHLRPYIFHGVDLTYSDRSSQATAECPFCGREGKFSANVQTGVWRCLVCNEGEEKGKTTKGGNAYTFIRKLFDLSYAKTPVEAYETLAKDRRLLEAATLVMWNVSKSSLTGEWMVPGYGPDGRLNQLYKYVRVGEKMCLLPTPTLHHQIHGMNLYDPVKPDIMVCEGPWDGMAAWEVMSQAKRGDDGRLSVTASEGSSSLTAACNIIAVPGCEVFNEAWLPLLTGKRVRLMYDSDHPREHGGRTIPPAGWGGVQRIASILHSANGQAPVSVEYLRWGEGGYDPSLPSGYDVRDHLSSVQGGLATRLPRLGELLDRIHVLSPTGAPTTSNPKVTAGGGKDLLPERCTDYKTLVNAWRKALQWTDGLDCALSAMLSSVLSTMSVGDQLWFKVMSPPSTGKTTIAEGITVAKKYAVSRDTVRGFTSGYKLDDGTTKDLASELDGMNLFTMDGDTLMTSPNLPNILSDGRRLYDGELNSHFKNATGKNISGHRMTWTILGTTSLRAMDKTELGARFLDCVIMEEIDDDLEDDILMRVANRSSDNVSKQVKAGVAESRRDGALTKAMCLTGGYVVHLRESAEDILSMVELEHEEKRLCTRYGKFVAFMRARPSVKQTEHAEREMASRLVSCLIRLAKCEAGVLNKTVVDAEVMRRVKRVTLDTARGHVLDITGYLYSDEDGSEVKTIANHAKITEEEARKLLRFMRQIGIVDLLQSEKVPGGVTPRPRWHLTARLRKLYADVMVNV